MRQQDADGRIPTVTDREFFPDGFEQRSLAEKLSNRKFAHRQDQLRRQESELPLEPLRTVRDFIRCGNAVTPLGPLAGEAATHSREINSIAHFVLRPSERAIEPFEKRLARGPCEWPAEFRL